jgi:hypothetical protein
MSASLTIQFPGELGSFVKQQRWSWLEQELSPAMQAAESVIAAGQRPPLARP